MVRLHAAHALTPTGWCHDCTITIEGGLIASITPGRSPGAEAHHLVLPGLPNLHSHAFQRGMAGLAETSGLGRDDFWTWRETMYRFALTMTPDDVEAVAGQLYVEMLETGFTRVGEFHYLHHGTDGTPYANPAEMAARIAGACSATGINLTLLPVFYRQGGFAGAPARPEQRRFLTDPDRYGALCDASADALKGLPGATLGLAPHSLRAATPDDLRAVVAMADGRPVHIHAAEQVREVEDCVAWSGARPVEWLLANTGADATWCFIHATHMTATEAGDMAGRGIVAGLCPITEANLGDGLFDGSQFMHRGGSFGVGTDSNVSVDAADELRQLEYSQRLRTRSRNALCEPGGSSGLYLVSEAVAGGNRALGQTRTGIAVGAPADLVSLDAADPTVACRTADMLLDTWIFGRTPRVDCVWTRGIRRVSDGRHHERDRIGTRFAESMKRLLA